MNKFFKQRLLTPVWLILIFALLLFADYQQRLSGESGLLETKPVYFYLYSPQDKVTNRQ